ncbi:hypothetical protein P7C71_g1682, partial [Lecanoromycetidae sp. Uapishka_2]
MSSAIPSSMKAWHFSQATGGLEKNLKLNNAASLPPKANSLGADEILVKVLSTTLNPIDFKIAELPLLGRLAIGTPCSPGLDFAGSVAATGANSKNLQIGQLVFGRLDMPTKFGTLAEYTIAPSKGCVPLPEGLSPDDGACIGTAGITAYQSLVPYVKAGDRVFINGGSGGTGVLAIQIAKILGCYVVTSCSSRNNALCRSLGADEVILYDKQDVLAELEKIQKFDHVVDNVGTPAGMYWESHKISNEGAVYLLVGATPSLGMIYDVMCRFLWPGFLGGGKRKFSLMSAVSDPESLKKMADWIVEGKIKIVVDEVFEMEDKGPVRAFEKLKTGHAKGKIVVRVAAS